MKNRYIIILIALLLASYTLKDNQLLPTNLKVTVVDELGNIQEGAKVTLYKTDADYRAEKNPASKTETTDKKGTVKFKKLDPIVYFVHVEKGDMNNDGGGVQTDTLLAGKTNKVNIVIR